MSDEGRNDPEHRFFSGEGAALRVIDPLLRDARIVRIATGFFEPSGYQCLRSSLRGKEIRLLLGRPEADDSRIESVIDEFFEALASGNFDERTQAMTELRESLLYGRFLVSLSAHGSGHPTTIGPRHLHHHAKLYIADESAVAVTSSNFSYAGLVASREAGYVVRDARDVAFFVERFDHYYEQAVPVAEELLRRLEEWLNVYRPHDIYLRSLIELYGLPDEERPGRLPELAGYQRPIVSRVLRIMEDYGGAMLIASTGLGKTVMAGHLVAYLAMQQSVNAVIVLCPAGLRSMWQRTMRAARVTSVEFSYFLLSIDDWRRYRDIGQLEYELRCADEQTLVILDESHHLRNQYDGGDLRLRHRRIIDMVGRRAKILLMTATPYSRDIEDVNAQLMLLPRHYDGASLFGGDDPAHWRVDTPGEIAETPSCVVLTAPSVVRYFSSVDENGERYVVFSGNQRRYFPRVIHLKNIHYENPCDDLLIELFESGLLAVKSAEREVDEQRLFDVAHSGRRDPLMEARFVHQFCSSVREVDGLLGKLEREEGFERLRFARQDELTRRAAELRCRIAPLLDEEPSSGGIADVKLSAIVDIIDHFPARKVVIFCVYRETARYVRDRIKLLRPGRSIEMTLERDPDSLDDILRRFAPVANSIRLGDEDEPMPEGEGIDILVATTAMSEGFNFQDASVLINFDLPWTVLVLAQRMGRILRPWHEPREIYVYNLIPSTMDNESIHHALNWKERLNRRGREFTTFAEIPVMVEQGSAFEMAQLSNSINTIGDVDLNLDEVFSFIERADQLHTTSFIDDLAALDGAVIRRIRNLPPGIRSYKKSGMDAPKLYALFRFKGRVYPALFNRDATIHLDSERMDDIMLLIRSDPDEEPHLAGFESVNYEAWLDQCRNNWAARRMIPAHDIMVLCYMALV